MQITERRGEQQLCPTQKENCGLLKGCETWQSRNKVWPHPAKVSQLKKRLKVCERWTTIQVSTKKITVFLSYDRRSIYRIKWLQPVIDHKIRCNYSLQHGLDRDYFDRRIEKNMPSEVGISGIRVANPLKGKAPQAKKNESSKPDPKTPVQPTTNPTD